MVLQHPCAIRLDGVRLASKLLVAEVNAAGILQPSKWADGYFKVLPLAELRPSETTKHYAASFDKHHLVTPAQLAMAGRIACLSQRGVNLMLQRWVHHNSRVVVPTQMYQEVSSPQFEEADMIEDWCIDREEDGVETIDATHEVDDWLSHKDDKGIPRRAQLQDEQKRSELRREIRSHLREIRKE